MQKVFTFFFTFALLNLCTFLPAFSQPSPAMPGKNVPAIKVDTVGYPSGWPKMAVFNVNPKGAVIKTEKGKVAYKVKAADIHSFGVDPASKDPVWQVDFSALSAADRYYFQAGKAKSDPFSIGLGLYEEALQASIKSFYYQRCRTALTEPFAKWKDHSYTRRGPCHAHAEVGWDMADYPQKKNKFVMDAGWHDAGNFDMYVCSTAPTCQAILLAYERHPELFKSMNLNIPESGNGTPDILNECRWGLRWVLCMQDKNGGFHARDAVFDWSPTGPADEDNKTRWVAGVGTVSTAKACAALALAARVYAPFDAVFAKRCGEVAQKGWDFLQGHPKHIVLDNHGSEQTVWDEGADMPQEGGCRLAAAVEMWRTYGKPEYLEAAQGYLKEPQTQALMLMRGAWVDIARWPVVELAEDKKVPTETRDDCKKRVLDACATVRDFVEKSDGYRCVQGMDGYIWSSNEIMMQEAFLLAEAAKLDPTQTWAKEAARDQWHWILGRNPNGFSMVTSIGKEPNALYHCEWGKSPAPPPGYLEGGPNSHNAAFLAPDAPAKALLWDNPKPLNSGLPAHHLWHWEESDLWDGGFVPRDKWDTGWWVVTEPDINSNADFILAAAEFQE